MTLQKLLIGTAAALLLATSPAVAEFALAEQLGDLMASEQICHLTFNQDAIRRFINENVKASDMDFTNQLALVVRVHTREHAKLSGISLVAQCEQVQRVAQAHGFIQ
jgi:hypothetical protein